jgi:pimeloyl-ACP methyl ester carboxylesterase
MSDTATPTTAATESGYASVNGLKMYYEIHGAGEGVPLIVLHGAYQTGTGAGIAGMGDFVAPLSAGRRVIAPDLQSHGRTADVDRPIRYETLADDVAALLDHLGVVRADLFGYSMGGAAALQVAIRHPDRVGKLVVASTSSGTGSDAVYPEVFAGFEQITPEVFAGTPFLAEYERVAPTREAFPQLVARLKDLDAQEFAWPDEHIRAIAAPTMIVVGDADIVRPEHAVTLLRLRGGGVIGDMAGLPNARLAILPGTSHLGMAQRAAWLVPMIEEFLAAPVAEGA